MKFAEESTIQIAKSVQEIYVGDRLLPAGREVPNFGYVPRAPQKAVRGRIVSAYGGLGEAGPLSIVTLSKGSQDGLEVGHVLAIYRSQSTRALRAAHLAAVRPPGPERQRLARGRTTASEITPRDGPLYTAGRPGYRRRRSPSCPTSATAS